ncbi:MAG: hypothetical protein ACYTAQ_15900 [Planctomycetota bacterium]
MPPARQSPIPRRTAAATASRRPAAAHLVDPADEIAVEGQRPHIGQVQVAVRVDQRRHDDRLGHVQNLGIGGPPHGGRQARGDDAAPFQQDRSRGPGPAPPVSDSGGMDEEAA